MDELKVCRLCFTPIHDKNYEIFKVFHTEMVSLLSIPVDLSMTEHPVMCNDCSESLQKSFNFRMTCTNSENCIKSFAETQDTAKVDLRDVLLKELLADDVKIEVQEKICRLCFDSNDSSYYKLDDLGDMLKTCAPELDLNLTVDPVLCLKCLDCLKEGFAFVNICSETEDRIKKYYDLRVDDAVQSKVDLRQVYFMEIEDQGGTFEKQVDEVEEFGVHSQEIFIKTEMEEYDEHPTQPSDTNEYPNILQNVQPVIPKMYACKHCDYETQNKRDLKIHSVTHTKDKKLYECPTCPFITRHYNVLENHKLTHKSVDEVEWYHCEICTYRTKLKTNLYNHSLTHQTPDAKRFKCDKCPYRSLWRRDLLRHMVKHKPPEEVILHKCDYCDFATKHVRYLRQHTAKQHLGEGEGDTQDAVFSCANCSFTTKQKRSLIPHMLLHRNPDDLVMYRCSTCPYKTKRKESIRKHEQTHENKYNCDECDFSTTLKRYLDKHKKAHRSLESLETLVIQRCDLCPFQTSTKLGLQKHSIVHKPVEELTMHFCPHCEHKSKRLADMKQHILKIHTDDYTIYGCMSCDYKTRYKYNFKKHVRMMHERSTEHKCDRCDFTTKYKSSLASHTISHHEFSKETPKFKCTECQYETKKKDCLKKHLVRHKRPEETEMFSCGNCQYRTKYKRALKQHVLGHLPGGRPRTMLICDRCGFETRRRQTLNKHMGQHASLDGEVEACAMVKQEVELIKEEILS